MIQADCKTLLRAHWLENAVQPAARPEKIRDDRRAAHQQLGLPDLHGRPEPDAGEGQLPGQKRVVQFPLGVIMRFFGGIPVDRSRNTGMVDAMIAEFGKHDRLVLMIPPEGTRGYVKEWKTGFYRVAVGAGVPIVLGYLDYGRKEAGLGKAFYPSGDYEKDLAAIQAFYRPMRAKHPERSSLR
jgi:hypothetical protein